MTVTKVERGGKIVSLEIGAFPTNPKPVEVDALMKEIGEVLGRNLGAVKLSGYWIIGDTTRQANGRVWSPLFGHQPGQQSRKFTKALAGALQLAIVQDVPFK